MRDDEERAGNILNRLEQLLHPVIDGRGIILEHFAAVRAEEREACAKVCRKWAESERQLSPDDRIGDGSIETCERLAALFESEAIRTRTE